jgi:hypothetical protein
MSEKFDFTKMIQTSGVASSDTQLFIANNAKITKIVYSASTPLADTVPIHIPHPYGWIGALTLGREKLFGIFIKNEQYGIFSMKIADNKFDQIYLDYHAVNLCVIYSDNVPIIQVIDTFCILHAYSDALQEMQVIKPFNFAERTFMRSGMTMAKSVDEKEGFLFTIDNRVYLGPEVVLTIDQPTIYGISFYNKTLLVLAPSGSMTYEVQTYAYESNMLVKKTSLAGGTISYDQMYMCVFRDSLYISATENKIVPLTGITKGTDIQFNFSPLDITSYTFTQVVSSDSDKSTFNSEKIKEHSLILDRPMNRTLGNLYVWGAIGLLLVSILILMVNGGVPSFLYGILLLLCILLFLIGTFV